MTRQQFDARAQQTQLLLKLNQESLKELGAWGKATKIWFDPKHFWNPVKLENVVELMIQLDYNAKDSDYEQEDPDWFGEENYVMNEDGGKSKFYILIFKIFY